VVKSELISTLNDKLPELELKDVELGLNCLIEQMVEVLAQGERIEVRGFGGFECRRRFPRIGRNPKTGAAVNLLAKTAIHFKPGKEMRERINVAREHCNIKD